MCKANQADRGPNCKCLSCEMSDRLKVGQAPLPLKTPCKFKLWFEAYLTQCGLTTKIGNQIGEKLVGRHMSMDNGYSVYDVDAHFHHRTHADWITWTYGARLWNAQSADDPELAKLHSLFQELKDVIYEEED